MIEPGDYLNFRDLMGEGARLMEEIIVRRYTGESKDSEYPDAAPTVNRNSFRVRAEIAPYPLQVMQQAGGVLRAGDQQIMCAQPLIGATGDENKAADETRADIVVWKGSTYRVYNLPVGHSIDGGRTLWVGTLRLLSGI